MLRRKWTLRACDQRIVLVKKQNERVEHVLMKAFLWALYLPKYPDLIVEIRVGDRYKPDVVSLGDEGRPCFWGEAGHVGVAKLRSLLRRYPYTHFAIAKWNTQLEPWVAIVRDILVQVPRFAPVDLLNIPNDSVERFVDERGTIRINHEAIDWINLVQDRDH